jgi:regulatory protein
MALDEGERIRSVRPEGGDQNRFRVRIGRAAFGPVHAADIDALGLSAGDALDGQTRDGLAEAMAREAARSEALRLLRTRARSRGDLARRLARKGHDRQAAAAALDRLARVGLIDDAALAADRAEALASRGRAGPRAAEQRLRASGIEQPIAARAVRAAYEGVDLQEHAAEAARKRARTLSDRLDPATRRRRLYGFLARRGYDHETCAHAVEQALGHDPRPDDEP